MNSIPIKAYNLYETIRIKDLRNVLPGTVLETSVRDMVVQFPDGGWVFVFQFGCVVFFNLSDEKVAECLDILGKSVPIKLDKPTYEQYFIKKSGTQRVAFDFVELTVFSMEFVRLVAMTIGQSAALEYYEVIADDLLKGSQKLIMNLARGKPLPWWNKQILKTIGTSANARQNIISNVWVLDPPDDTWNSADLEKLFKDLQQNFDIDMRFKTLEKKLTIVQENNEILADLVSSRTTALMELLIVILIVIEIVMALTERHSSP